MARPTPTYSGIILPTTPKNERRGSILGSSLQHSSQSLVPSTSIQFDEPRDRRDSFGMHSGIMRDRSDRSDNIRSADFHESLPAKRVSQMDMEFQRMKLYDGRKRPQSQNFQESNGTFYSNFVSERVARILQDYRRVKYEDNKFVSRRFGHLPLDQHHHQGQLKRTSSSLSLTHRSGSFTNLSMMNSTTKQEEYGPVEQVEWFSRENAREHRTDRYEITQYLQKNYPVFRRGQPFYFAIKLASRNMDLRNNPVFVTFNFGSNPSIGKCTRICLTVTGDKDFLQNDKSDWDIRVHNQEGNILTLQVLVSPTAPVGSWTCEIQHDNDFFRCHEDIYILFNPYCSEDPVFVDNEQFRKEYVLNESGKVYCGTYNNLKTYKWIYGQFSDIILPMVTLFLDRFTEGNRNTVDYSQRGSPVFVSRALACMIYSKFGIFKEPENQDEGFNSFNFSGTYSVFEKILNQNFRPVETDQSYLASAVYVTCCRALGLPCRSVTSYRSPVQKTSLNVDIYWTEENERESDLYQAYQCWNDVWMRRDDIVGQSSYLGWQAIDPNYQGCGPAPSEAVRRGEVGTNFDISYFYAMLNSKFRHFYTNNFPEKIIHDDIGRLVVTKRYDRDDDMDNEDFEDITHLYKKKKDGTDEEKFLVTNALKGNSISPTRRGSIYWKSSSMDRIHTIGRKEDIFSEWDNNPATFGQNTQASLVIQNTCGDLRNIVVNMFARPVYNGIVGRKIKQIRRQFTIQPNQRESVNLELFPFEYQDRLDDDYLIRYYACIYTKETNQFWASDEDFSFSKPRLNIQMRGSPQVDSEMPIIFTMVNPLSIPLTDCYIFYEAAGCSKPVFRRIKDIKPGEMLNLNETIVPRRGGESRMVGVFNSRQLRNATGSLAINVRE